MADAEEASPSSPAGELLGRRVLEMDAQAGTVRLSFDAGPQLTNRYGNLFGGFLAAMLDATTATAVFTGLDEGARAVTTDLRVSFERPGEVGRLEGVGRVASRDEREVTAQGELLNPEGQVVARAEATFRILRRR